MKTSTFLQLLFFSLVLISCSDASNHGQNGQADTAIRHDYEIASDKLQQLIGEYSKLSSDISVGKVNELLSMIDNLDYRYNPIGLDSIDAVRCELLKEKIESAKKNVRNNLDSVISNMRIDIIRNEDFLVESTSRYPVFLVKGDKFILNAEWETAGNIKLYNSNSRQLIRNFSAKKKVNVSIDVPNTAVYLLELSSKQSQYISIYSYYMISGTERLRQIKTVRSQEQQCSKNDFLARPITAIKTVNIFESPKKFTLRGHFKAMFSGSCRALVGVNIPEGTTDILYSLRISTSETDRSSDGEFNNNIMTSYRKVKVLGLPLYETSKGNGLLNMLLDDNRPIREEDAYCNMYVFRNSTDAKKFQDSSGGISGLDYDIDYSTIGTQSCDGRIPVTKGKNIYLGFENERMRYSNYIWVEVVAVVPITEYMNTEYSIQ